MTDHKQPTAGFWITVAVVAVLVGYPLSFGPACWWMSEIDTRAVLMQVPRRVSPIYTPIGWIAIHGPTQVQQAIYWYANVNADCVIIPTDWKGEGVVSTRR